MTHLKTLIAMAAGLGLLGLIPACPAPQHPDVYEGGAYTGDDDAVGDDDVGDDDVGDDDTGGGGNAAAFFNDYMQGVCELYFDCLDPGTLEHMGWTNLGDCIDQMKGKAGSMEGCTVDEGMAADCVNAVQSIDCETFLSGGGMDDCTDAYYSVEC